MTTDTEETLLRWRKTARDRLERCAGGHAASSRLASSEHRLSGAANAAAQEGAIQTGDWPMWRGNAQRGGTTPGELPNELHLSWILDLPEPIPAWPSTQDKLQFDRLYEPVVLGKRLFVPSMISDKVTAYDTETS